MRCIFCSIVEGKIPAFTVWENSSFLLILDQKPISPGHLLLIPKRHVPDIFSIPKPQFTALFENVRKISPILRKQMKAKRIGLAIEGFGVPHAHVHLVPVNKGNELNPLRAKLASKRTLKRMQEGLTRGFKKLR